MTTATKPRGSHSKFESPQDMLAWQWRSMIEELQELQRHLSDPSCPCILADSGEFCGPKHALGLHTLAKETIAMAPAHAEMLETLAEEALAQHIALKDRIVCSKPHKDEKDTVEWSRQWRKRLEPIYYACSVKGKGKMHQDGKEFCHFAASIGPNAAQTLLQEGSTSRQMIADVEQPHHCYDAAQKPQVTISGKCKGKESCTLKVKASESVEAVSTIGGLTKSIEDVLKGIEKTHAPAPSAVTFAIGSTTLTRYEFQNKLVEASDLLASHNPITFEPTPNYPPELQPRLRGRQANRSQVQNIAKNLDPDALLSDFHSIDRGAPIVGPDNVVESGNGRVMAIQLAVAEFPDVYARYRDELLKRAETVGVSREEANGMKAPVLVRVRLTDVPRRQFVEEANASTTLAPSAIEVARADASHLTLEMVQQLWVGDDQGIEDALRSLSNGQFVVAFLATIAANQRAQITDAKGQLNQDGIRRMVMALFVNAFPGDSGLRLAEKFFESTEPSVRNVFNGIAQALGKLAKSEGLCRSSARDPQLLIGEDIAASVSVYAEIKKTPGMTVAQYLGQSQMFERRLNPFQERLLKLIDERARSGKKIGQLLKGYAAIVMESTPPAQGSLIPGVVLTKDQALDAAISRSQAEPEPQPAMFQGKPKLTTMHCSALADAVKVLKAAAKSLTSYHTNLVKAEKKLDTTMSICKGQSAMFQAQRDLSDQEKAEDAKGQITIERLDKPPFTIKHGDTVAVWFSKNKWSQGTVVGISHVKKEVRVVFPGSVRGGGIWFALGALYPPDYPEAQGPKGKAPTVQISGKCGDKADSCTFTLKRQQKAIKAKGIDEALAAIDKLSKPCACADLKQEPTLTPIEGSLLNSMMEEHVAVQSYIARGGEAARAGDMKTALLYRHIAVEEGKHYDEFSARLAAKDVTKMGQSAKMDVYVEVRDVSHKYGGVPLLATTNNPSSSYGLPVVLDPKGKPIGPVDLFDTVYGKVSLGWLSVLYGVGFKELSEEQRISARKRLWNAGYCLAVSPLDGLYGCPPQTTERLSSILHVPDERSASEKATDEKAYKEFFGEQKNQCNSAKMEICPACILALASDKPKTAHTPGPWKVAGTEVWAGSKRITMGHGAYDEKDRAIQRANANLIASAPDLLQVGKQAYTQIGEDLIDDIYIGPEYRENYERLQLELGKAISKAEPHAHMHSSGKAVCTPSQAKKREQCTASAGCRVTR
jgi:hypothetical protein